MKDVCGNRTELCQTCRKYIRLREWIGHEIQCHTSSNGSADTSRYKQISLCMNREFSITHIHKTDIIQHINILQSCISSEPSHFCTKPNPWNSLCLKSITQIKYPGLPASKFNFVCLIKMITVLKLV
jgi:hypothetical protein